ncbi:MAG: hypothetical protein WAM70_17840, partial [Pyrinomonadaceae bacterium]
MADWLSKLESQRSAAKAAAEVEAARKQSNTSYVEQAGRRSYERNKERIEPIYTALTNHARRASDMGFTVTTQRDERNGFLVTGQYSYWDGERYSTGAAKL